MPAHPLLGQPAPSVTLNDDSGKDYTISPASIGIPTIIFFYPTSGTYGCTREACDFRDAVKTNELFSPGKCKVIGISAQDVAIQKKFVDDYNLPFPVLSDEKGDARKAYKVQRGMLGLTEGRITFFIDKAGTVTDVYDSVMNFHAHVKFATKFLEREAKLNTAAPTTTSSAEAPTAA